MTVGGARGFDNYSVALSGGSSCRQRDNPFSMLAKRNQHATLQCLSRHGFGCWLFCICFPSSTHVPLDRSDRGKAFSNFDPYPHDRPNDRPVSERPYRSRPISFLIGSVLKGRFFERGTFWTEIASREASLAKCDGPSGTQVGPTWIDLAVWESVSLRRGFLEGGCREGAFACQVLQPKWDPTRTQP